VVDSQTGRGVPLVQLETVNNIRLYTDSNGIAAFYEPGLMHSRVFFHVKSQGYEYAKDGFGFRGKALDIRPGGAARLEIRRVNIAQRLYRITGGGIYADSLLVGRAAPIRRPLLNGQVFGCDSVQTAVYHGKLYWFWGDTNRPAYPLGNFKTTGATSALPSALDAGLPTSPKLDPDVGIDLKYFVDESGFAKSMAPLESDGPVWLSGLTVLRDRSGRERMFAHYAKIHANKQSFSAYEQGLVEFDDRAEEFRQAAVFPQNGPFPNGSHSLLHADNGTNYVYFCSPFPLVRAEADPEKLKRLETYEAFTCLVPGSRLEQGRFDRAADSSLRWAWKTNTDVVGSTDIAELVKAGKMREDESPFCLRDAETGKPVVAHRGTVAWNDFRRRWVMIFCEVYGSSMLGEIWYTEAENLTGPWLAARKIVTHDRYSFYNPKHHPYFDAQGGRILYFEGTYTHTFSGNPEQTPRYDYNQIMYKLDLADPRLRLPANNYTLPGL
jgi:hypothetical protein